MFIFLYGLASALTAFGIVWLVSEIRKKEPEFLMWHNDDRAYLYCVVIASLWPLAAPVAVGILGAKYLIGKEK